MPEKNKVRRRVLACARCRKRKLAVHPHNVSLYRPRLTDVVTVRLQSAGLQSMLDRWREMRRLRLFHGFDFVLQEHS